MKNSLLPSSVPNVGSVIALQITRKRRCIQLSLWSPAFLEWFLPLILERHEKEASMLKQLFSKTAAMLCCLFVLTLYIPAPAAAQVIQSPSVNPGTLPSAPQGVQGENSA